MIHGNHYLSLLSPLSALSTLPLDASSAAPDLSLASSVDVAGTAVASLFGKYNGPFWPQAVIVNAVAMNNSRPVERNFIGVSEPCSFHAIIETSHSIPSISLSTRAAMPENTPAEAYEETITRLDEQLDECDADIDYDTVSDILTISFENGSKLIINYQAASDQLWLAARSGGFHYNYDAASGHWLNDRTGEDFLAELSRLATAQAGEEICFVR
jgi:CyaY protein